MRTVRAAGACLAAALLLAGCHDSTGTRAPRGFTIIAGNGQSGAAGANLANPLVVQVKDMLGRPVPNASVTWAVTAGGGTVTPATSTTDATGLAQTTWKLGTTAGSAQTVTATVDDLAPVTFTATVTAGPLAGFRFTPDSLRLTYIGQQATLQAQPVDAFGNATTAGPLTWTSLDPTIVAVTQANGVFTANALANGRARVQVSSGGVTAIMIVNVRQIARTVTLEPPFIHIIVGDTFHFTATARDANNVVIANPVFTWSTSAPGVATVDGTGKVTGVAPGLAMITATTDSASATGSVFVHAALRARSLDAGGFVGCVADLSGIQLCWGSNGVNVTFTTPTQVAPSLTYDSVTVGGAHVCGLTPAGTVYCWGENDRGQVGSRANDQTCRISNSFTYICVSTPVQVTGTWKQVSAGDDHTCALTPAGAAYCWGLNSSGQLGGTSSETCTVNAATGPDPQPCATTPIPVNGGLTFKQVSAGGKHTCALTTAGAAYCWGDNSTGALGTGNNTGSGTPVPVTGGLTFAVISAGTGYTCGVTTGGTGYCWGTGASGQLGTGGTTALSPTPVSGGITWREISAGWQHTCGVDAAGKAWCWGLNAEGQLGTGTAGGTSTTPVAVAGGLTFSVVRASGGPAGHPRDNGTAGQHSFSCAAASGSGAVYCWGSNDFFSVGDGTTTDRPAPVALRAP